MISFSALQVAMALIVVVSLVVLGGWLSLKRRRRRVADIERALSEDRRDDAVRLLEDWQSRMGDDGWSYLTIASFWKRLGEHERVLRVLGGVGELTGPRTRRQISTMRRDALIALGRMPELAELAETMRPSSPAALEGRLLSSGMALVGSRTTDAQMQMAERLLEREPDNPVGTAYLIRGLLDRARWAEALPLATELVARNPTELPRSFRAEALFGSGLVEEATSEFERFVEAGGVSDHIPLIRRSVLLRSGRYEEALGESTALVAQHPDSGQFRLLLAWSLWWLGRGADARKWLDEAIERAADPAACQHLDAILLADEGHADRARVAIDGFPEGAPNSFASAYVLCKLAEPGALDALQRHLTNAAPSRDNEILLALPAPGGGTWGDRITA